MGRMFVKRLWVRLELAGMVSFTSDVNQDAHLSLKFHPFGIVCYLYGYYASKIHVTLSSQAIIRFSLSR